MELSVSRGHYFLFSSVLLQNVKQRRHDLRSACGPPILGSLRNTKSTTTILFFPTTLRNTQQRSEVIESHFRSLEASPFRDSSPQESDTSVPPRGTLKVPFQPGESLLLPREDALVDGTPRTPVRSRAHCPALSNISSFGAVLESNRDGSLSRWPTARPGLIRRD